MIRIILLMFLVLAPIGSYAASLILSEDFEDASWTENFRSGTSNVARVNSNNHGGSYCIRGNLKEGLTDPIAGVLGENNPVLEFDANGFIAAQTGEIFIRYWRRLDDSTWSGTESGYGKGEYLTDTSLGTAAFYTRNWFLPSDYMLCDNGGFTSWCISSDNWDYMSAVMDSDTANPGGADGQWHKFEIYINYMERYITFWIDGHILKGINSGSSLVAKYGTQIGLPSDFHLRGLQFLYVHPEQINNSADGTGIACGYQYDDIEVWDGMPESPAVSGNGVSGSGVSNNGGG